MIALRRTDGRASAATAKPAETTLGAAHESEPVQARRTKLAAGVAQRIIADIVAKGWPEGEVLGSEPELLARYGVSRAVFREAVRLVEHQQVARMRRGPGGGLVITSPSLESVIDPVAVYLFYANARVGQVAEARIALEETVAELAPRRLSEDNISELRSLAVRERSGTTSDHRELHLLLASITKNPALDVFVNLLTRLTFLYLPDITRIRRDTLAAAAGAHLAIIDSVLTGNEGLTRHRMRKHLEAESEYLRRRVPAGQLLDSSVLRSLDDVDKRAERVARELFVQVAQTEWPVGELLGSEADLMARFGVSRAVLREAVRLLEHHQIAAMRRGPGGGLFVVEPGIDSAANAIALLLERRGITPVDLFELRTEVELAIVDLAVKRLDRLGIAKLQEAIEYEGQVSYEEYRTVGHDLHGVLASIVDNPVFELLALVLIRLTVMHQIPYSSDRAGVEASLRIHNAILDAIINRDADLARHRMRRHLEALTDFVR
jgi:DNA-binding FadR family transcriptional regulator